MAALALGALAAGGVLAPGTGLAIATIGATIIDQAFILPALFPTPSPDAPTLQDIEIQTVAEGSPINRFYGDQVRVSGHMIWRTELRISTEGSGGKGFGPKAKTGAQQVHGDVAIAFGIGHPLARLVAMWADEKLLYQESLGLNVPLTTASVAGPSNTHRILSDNVGQPQNRNVRVAVIERIASGGDPASGLGQFREGQLVNIHGITPKFTNSPGTEPDAVRLMAVSRGQHGPNTKIRFTPLLVGNPPRQTNWLTSANGAVFQPDARVTEFDDPWNPADMTKVHVHPGSDTQLPNEFMESVEGVDNVEAYRGIAYVVLENFNVTGYGNRYPNITAIWANNNRVPFEADDQRGPPGAVDIGYNFQNAIIDVVANAGIPRENFDIRGVRFFNGRVPKLTGLSIRGQQTTSKIIQPLLVAGQLLVQEDNGVLKFFLRTRAETVIINPEDAAAHEEGSELGPLINMTDAAEVRAPSAVEVHFNDENAELQPGHVRERRIDHKIDNITSMSLPISMRSGDAQAIAKAHLWTVLANRRQLVNITLPPSYTLLAEGDRITIDVYDEVFTFLITKVDRGENFLIKAEGVTEFHETLLFADETIIP